MAWLVLFYLALSASVATEVNSSLLNYSDKYLLIGWLWILRIRNRSLSA